MLAQPVRLANHPTFLLDVPLLGEVEGRGEGLGEQSAFIYHYYYDYYLTRAPLI